MIDICLLQWNKFKIKINKDLKGDINVDNLWQCINIEIFFSVGYDELKQVIQIYSIIPSSNAEVGRGFSALKRIKTLQRNRIGDNLLECLMCISLNGREIKDWNPQDSFSNWRKKNNLKHFEKV